MDPVAGRSSATNAILPSGEGHTEMSPEDQDGLIPSYIATRGDLFDAEQRNIVQALLRRPPRTEELLDDKYLRDLHHAMFGQVWSWAGQYRTHETNIGIEPTQIAVAVRLLVEDVSWWIERETFATDEIAIRFHHRLVGIHPFRNGNGRHGRVAADYLAEALGTGAFTWSRNLELTTNDLRRAYLSALQEADAGEIAPLLTFARS
ncbi:MAG: mobile mystery protein B [bacterium]|nr:mobile mystery protein B [bacterium]